MAKHIEILEILGSYFYITCRIYIFPEVLGQNILPYNIRCRSNKVLRLEKTIKLRKTVNNSLNLL